MNKKILEQSITSECRCTCAFCYNKENKHKDMTIEQFETNAIKAKKCGCEKCIIIGGEPLLHENIMDFLQICKKHGLYSSVWTSGTIDFERILGKCDDVVVSRNGLNDHQSSLVFGCDVIPVQTLTWWAKHYDIKITTLHNAWGVNDNKSANEFKGYYGGVSSFPIRVIKYKIRTGVEALPNIKFSELDVPIGMYKKHPDRGEDRYYAVCGDLYRCYVPVYSSTR